MKRMNALAVVAVLGAALVAPAGYQSARAAQTKNARANAPATLNSKLRDKVKAREKTDAAEAAKAAGRPEAARLAPAQVTTPERRAEQFRARARQQADDAKADAPAVVANKRGAIRPSVAPTSARAKDLDTREGTGGGDVNEQEPNDETAQTLDDIPINVVGAISPAGDVDFFTIPVEQGDPIRVEVVADSQFNSQLDSFLTILRDDGETVIASNDDSPAGGTLDSFVRFTAPYTGYVFIGVEDSGGLGGSNFVYVLNASVAGAPDVSEVELNDDAQSADEVIVPQLVFGESRPSGDFDVFVFDGIAGETLIVDVDAEIFLSDIDAVAGLYDDTGGALFVNDDEDGVDPRFNIVLPYTGTYYVSVEDRLGRGGTSFYYTLNLSTTSGALAPRVTGVKVTSDGFMKKVIGSRFQPGAFAELNSERVSGSSPAPRKPTTVIRIKPAIEVFDNDVITVVNPGGRRSNPGILQ